MSDIPRTWSCETCGRRLPSHLASCPHCEERSDALSYDDPVPLRDRRGDPAIGARSAVDTLQLALVAGLLVSVAGAVVAALAWPGTEEIYDVGRSSYDREDTGNAAVALLGLAVCSIGNLVLLLGIIGYGVMLGVRAAAHPRR